MGSGHYLIRYYVPVDVNLKQKLRKWVSEILSFHRAIVSRLPWILFWLPKLSAEMLNFQDFECDKKIKIFLIKIFLIMGVNHHEEKIESIKSFICPNSMAENTLKGFLDQNLYSSLTVSAGGKQSSHTFRTLFEVASVASPNSLFWQR